MNGDHETAVTEQLDGFAYGPAGDAEFLDEGVLAGDDPARR